MLNIFQIYCFNKDQRLKIFSSENMLSFQNWTGGKSKECEFYSFEVCIVIEIGTVKRNKKRLKL